MSRIRADKISNKAGTGAVQLQYGAEVPVGYGITGAGTINVTGVITAASFAGSGANLTGIDATSIKDTGGSVKIQAQASGAVHTGIATFNNDIDVDGHTNLDNVSVAGIATFGGNRIDIATWVSHTGDPDTRFGFYGPDELTFETGGSERLRINSSGLTVPAGNVTAVDGTFTGNVSVGATLTYEDVTNVDAVGLITARSGINITDATESTSTTTGSLKLAGGVGIVKNLYLGGQEEIVNTTQASSTTTGALRVAGGVGIVKNLHVGGTITGDGSALTGITGTTINNNANNRIITGSGTANTLEAEAGLTWDGNQFKTTSGNRLEVVSGDRLELVSGNSQRIEVQAAGNIQMTSATQTDIDAGTSLTLTTTAGYIVLDSSQMIKLNSESATEIQVPLLEIKNQADNETMAKFIQNGGCILYHDNVIKASTASGGFTVTGTCTATSFAGDGSSLTGIGGTEHIHAQTLAVVGVTTLTGTVVNKVDSTTENSVIIGEEASANNTNTDSCVIIGKRAGYQNATGKYNNTFVGYQAGYAGGGTISNYNTMVGSGAGMFMYGDAQECTAIGHDAGYFNAKNYCVSVGAKSGASRGEFNVAIGGYANGSGNELSSSWMTYPNSNSSTQWGDNNICIGYQANTPNANTDHFIVIGNAQHTNFVVGRLGFEITAGVTTNTGSLVVGAGVSAVGIVTASGGLSIGPGVLAEKSHVDSGGGITGTYNHDVLTYGMVWYGSSNAAGTWTFNVRGNGSTSFDTLMNTGETTTMTMISGNNNAANYMTAFQIQGVTQTVEWAGGTAPSAGTGSGYDSYVVTIIKLGSNSYKCFGNFTNFN